MPVMRKFPPAAPTERAILGIEKNHHQLLLSLFSMQKRHVLNVKSMIIGFSPQQLIFVCTPQRQLAKHTGILTSSPRFMFCAKGSCWELLPGFLK